MSSIYKILSNPFYAGVILWGGQTYPGKHEPVVSIDEFERIQPRLHRIAPTRIRRHRFPFLGLIRCATCGYRITAQYTTNRYGTRYTYYHCVKQRLGPRCREPALEAQKLEAEISGFLRSLVLEPGIAAWLVNSFDLLGAQMKDEVTARRARIEQALAAVRNQLRELTGLRLRNLLTDEEFIAQREGLRQEERKFAEKAATPDDDVDCIKPVRDVMLFCNQAADWFQTAPNDTKALILKIAASNPTMAGGKLNIHAAKPFLAIADLATCPSLLADLDVNQTLNDSDRAHLLATVSVAFVDDEERRAIREPAEQASCAVANRGRSGDRGVGLPMTSPKSPRPQCPCSITPPLSRQRDGWHSFLPVVYFFR